MHKSILMTTVLMFVLAGCSGEMGTMAEDAAPDDANAAIAASVPSTDIVLVALDAVMAQRDPGGAKNVAVKRGYDNQPAFSADGRFVFFSRIAEGGQSDVYRYTIDTGKTDQITQTPQSEYSPTPLPGGGFSCVQVALDGTQRLWRYDDQGKPQGAIRADITGVGYHAWLSSDDVALFIVAEPMRLEVAPTAGTRRAQISTYIGRSVLRTPDGELSFVQGEPDSERRVLVIRDKNGELDQRAELPGPGQDLVWLADGSVLVADGRTLYRLAPAATEWVPWVNLARSVAGDISRMAADPTGRWLALVVSESE